MRETCSDVTLQSVNFRSGFTFWRLTNLKIAKLGELFPAIIKLASKRLDLLVNNHVCSDISALSEGLAADVAVIWPLPGMAPLVCLGCNQYMLVTACVIMLVPLDCRVGKTVDRTKALCTTLRMC